ncbi:MAG: hypothetical protein EXS67_03420 [Candidatus Margulisbacteria bacterium]|nr:hypothetical protein [Candidatus Margulisiibacteriota bacterium]
MFRRKMKALHFVLLGLCLLTLSGCKDVYLLEDKNSIGKDQAVLLVDIQGNSAINYIQFVGVFPAINIRFPAKHNELVAIVVPVGTSGIEFSCFTYEGKPSGYIPIGYTARSFGYIPIKGIPPLNVPKPGIYFFGTLNTDTQTYSPTPNIERLPMTIKKYGELLNNLESINFSWPKEYVHSSLAQ